MSAKHHVKKAAKTVLRPGTRRFLVARKIAEKSRLIKPVARDPHYVEWVERTEPFTWSKQQALSYQPLISIVVPVFNPPAQYFLPMVDSVLNQTYQNWELILVNASTKRRYRQQAEDCAKLDNRVKVVNLTENHGIAGNTNKGLDAATGDYVALLDHDDLIAPQALYEMVLRLQAEPSAGLVYSDEDKVSADGIERFDPHFKPDWSPQLLRHVNYINHFSIIKKTVLKKIGGYRTGFDGAQDYDLYLRVTDENLPVLHVPKILYHWRTAETSTANDFSAKDNILSAGERAINDHLVRHKIKGKAKAVPKQPGFYRVSYEPTDSKVAVIILPMTSKEQYSKLVDYYHDILGGHDTELIAGELPEPRLKDVTYLEATDAQTLLLAAAKQSTAKSFVVIGAGVVPITKHWLLNLTAPLMQDKSLSLVAPVIVDSDKTTIYDAGLAKIDQQYLSLFKGYQAGAHTYFGNSDWTRNVDSLSGRCFSLRASDLEAVAACIKKAVFQPDLLQDFFQKQGQQVCITGDTKMKFVGDAHRQSTKTQFFNPNLAELKIEYGNPRLINVPQVGEYED